MIKLGITGGIGSGKSIVSEIFRVKGIPVYDADSASKQLISFNETLKKALSDLLGPEIYDNGKLDRKRMAEIIFHDKDLLAKTNAIIHPAVGEDFFLWSEKQNAPIVATESALLFESKFDKKIDKSIMVYAPLEIRLSRVIQRDQTTIENVKARIANQMDDEEKKKLADFVIINDNKQALLPQIEEIIRSL